MYPLLLKPVLKDYIWGGIRLKDEFNKSTNLEKVAESWELSCHKDGSSVILNGEYKGISLNDYIAKEGKNVLGKRATKFNTFPILIKLIDAKDRLSIQVHPNDEYAMVHEGEYGKTEMWYIVDCDPGASLIYGFNKNLTKEEFQKRIEENTILEVCNEVFVKKGDVFFIEAGTLHAIGSGIVIAEVQENSNSTYRVYDYERKDKDGKKRELHINKAIDVTNLNITEDKSNNHFKEIKTKDYEMKVLAECEYFKTSELIVKTQCDFLANDETFQSLLVLDGTPKIIYDEQILETKKGDSIFIPSGMGKYKIKGECKILFSEV